MLSISHAIGYCHLFWGPSSALYIDVVTSFRALKPFLRQGTILRVGDVADYQDQSKSEFLLQGTMANAQLPLECQLCMSPTLSHHLPRY